MLRFLSIRQLAVIDELEVEFGPGLNVLTGETGAGKSIIVEALDLLLGGRSSSDLVRTGAESSKHPTAPRSLSDVKCRRRVAAAPSWTGISSPPRSCAT
jgi:DNA repair protein RecN (Recombination protein N)